MAKFPNTFSTAMFDVSAARQTEPEKSLGTILAEARQALDLPLEKVARETRIRVQRLREIEANDFSQFSHPSYVRMFLMDYSRYLGISETEIRDFLPDRGECGAAGYQYMQEIAQEEVLPFPRQSAPRRRLLPVALAVVSILVCSFFGARLWLDIDRLKPTTASTSVEPVEDWSADKQILGEVGVDVVPVVTQPAEDPAPVDAGTASDFDPSPVSAAVPQVDAVYFVGGSLEHDSVR